MSHLLGDLASRFHNWDKDSSENGQNLGRIYLDWEIGV
jgi:hypothetical protein